MNIQAYYLLPIAIFCLLFQGATNVPALRIKRPELLLQLLGLDAELCIELQLLRTALLTIGKNLHYTYPHGHHGGTGRAT